MRHARFWLVLALLLSLVTVQAWLVLRAGPGRGDDGGAAGPVVSTVPLSETIVAWGGLGGVSVDSLGFVYMADFVEGVWKIAPDGTVTLWGDGLNGSAGNAVDRNGDLLQASHHDGTVRRIDRRGTMTTLVADGLDGPLGVYAAPNGDVWVSNCWNHTVVRVRGVGPEQTVEVVASGDPLVCPNGITGDDAGNVYVTSFDDDALFRIAPDGTLSTVAVVAPPNGYSRRHLEMGIEGNSHLAFAGDRFYVAKSKTNSIWEVRLDGTVRHFAGSFKPEGGDGPLTQAGIAHPNGIAFSDGTLYFNTIEGPWREKKRGRLDLRRIDLKSVDSSP